MPSNFVNGAAEGIAARVAVRGISVSLPSGAGVLDCSDSLVMGDYPARAMDQRGCRPCRKICEEDALIELPRCRIFPRIFSAEYFRGIGRLRKVVSCAYGICGATGAAERVVAPVARELRTFVVGLTG